MPRDRRALPYAKAVFEIAKERGQVETIGRELESLAEQIKALKSAHTIEGPAQRAERRSPAAEEPVTARIRRGWSIARAVTEPVRRDPP